MRWSHALTEEARRCSFCHKSQDVVGKLISSPNDYPRAYICDECIAVCHSILEDERHDQHSARAVDATQQAETSPLLDDSLVIQFLNSVERWIKQESLGLDAAQEFAEMRSLAIGMMRPPK
jgi:hypothetical protein